MADAEYIEKVYTDLGIAIKPFKMKEGLPQEPRINVTEIINDMRKQPGYLMKEEHQAKGK